MREGVSAVNPHRPGVRWLAAVLVCFCLPLFVNLGTPDLDNDEAIYSFAVDRMVATGDWLVPRAIPHGDAPFLEKPPLKFWMVALPMRAGWLPPDEFGMRFWDAVFGAASFVYVFLIGTWFLNPVCGFIAVLLLFAIGYGKMSSELVNAGGFYAFVVKGLGRPAGLWAFLGGRAGADLGGSAAASIAGKPVRSRGFQRLRTCRSRRSLLR